MAVPSPLLGDGGFNDRTFSVLSCSHRLTPHPTWQVSNERVFGWRGELAYAMCLNSSWDLDDARVSMSIIDNGCVDGTLDIAIKGLTNSVSHITVQILTPWQKRYPQRRSTRSTKPAIYHLSPSSANILLAIKTSTSLRQGLQRPLRPLSS